MLGFRKRRIPPPRKRVADLQQFENMFLFLLVSQVEMALSVNATALLFGFRPDAPPAADVQDDAPPPPPLSFPINMLAPGTPMHVWWEIDNHLYPHLDIPISAFLYFQTLLPERIFRVPPTPAGPVPGEYLEIRPSATARRFVRVIWQWRADNLSGLRLLGVHETALDASLPGEERHYNPWAAENPTRERAN